MWVLQIYFRGVEEWYMVAIDFLSLPNLPKATISLGDLVKVADGLGDVIYVCIGAALAFGIPIGVVLSEIHRSNMSKVSNTGATEWRDDGKVLRGEQYSAPDLARILKP